MTMTLNPSPNLQTLGAYSGLSANALRACRGEVSTTLALAHGGEKAVSIRYELVGPEGAPLLVVAGGISAGRHALSSGNFPDVGWWQVQAATLGQSGYRILSIDWLGADGLLDVPIDPSDQARAFVHLLDELRLARAEAFIGASYGGMVGMHVAALYPDRVGALLAISAAATAHPYSSACRSLQRRAVALGESAGDAAAGVALARALAMLTYRTPEEFGDRFPADPRVESGIVRVAAEDYLDHQGARHCRRMSAAAYRRLSESIDLHRIDPDKIDVPLTLVAVDSDALVPAADMRALADAVPGATFHQIHSRFGHDAFLKEERQVAAVIADFLETLEPVQ